MDKTLHYLFDPLCGWCYGTAPVVAAAQEAPGVRVELHPTGLFSGPGARPMDDAFAAFAWSNDQRIARLTGQRFTEAYRHQVLGDRQGLLDSGPATVALTAVRLTEPARELEALKAIQNARYVSGSDVTSLAVLAKLLEGLALGAAAARIAHPDADLLAANQARTARAQALMREVGARGVPTLIVESGEKRRVLDHTAAYANAQAVVAQLEAAWAV
jgi:putative protein-disulfide isomerase